MITLDALSAATAALSFRDWVFLLTNLVIPAGYLYVAVKVLPILPVSDLTKIGSRVFFVLCAMTHLDVAYHMLFSPGETYRDVAGDLHMLLIHVPQAIAVWVFAVGFFRDLKRLRTERHTTEPAK